MINGSVHFGVCHDFYVGKAPFIVSNTTSLRLDIIEAVNFVPSALFMLWLLVTLPWAIKRFYNAQKGQLGIIAYFALIWATALFRGLRFVILWAFMHGDAPSNLTTVEGIMYMMYLSCALTVEAAFLLLFINGVFGNPKWLDRRVLIQSAFLFVSIFASQALLTFVGKFSLLEDDDTRNSPFWLATEAAFTVVYGTVILLKFLSCSKQRFPPGKLVLTYLLLLMLMHGITALGQLLMLTKTRHAFCPLIVGNVSYYYLASPLLYATFLGTYLHPKCCQLFGCCQRNRYHSIVGDDTLYDYQPVDTLPTSKNWIPPSQLNFSSPYYAKNMSGYLSSASLSETEFSTNSEAPRTTDDSEAYFDPRNM